ncbi:hypothetical protein GCM10007049_07370 [Echinicola pacifica]|uniref:AAA+ ATPase domain-containing protein n=1 Tax=Echinicola pacifica TaxID=346377 RepID=A0A918UK42_9BACT|nr:ATP-binding protein [Echinicola pacifica]GGZ17399.1 hypothetical protein GCM10007049_07370 [Echinicola pacifica]
MVDLIHFVEMAIKARMDFFTKKTSTLVQPQLNLQFDPGTELGKFVQAKTIPNHELLLLGMALVPHLDPGFYSRIIAQYFPDGHDLVEFGGLRSKSHRGIIPTGETYLFVVAGIDIATRKKYFKLLKTALLIQLGVIHWGSRESHEPEWASALVMDAEYAERFTTDQLSKPVFGTSFPAEPIETSLEWTDLVLNAKTLAYILEIQEWLEQHQKLWEDWGMAGRIKPGFRVMFYGPPGTGKTLTAGLLGKHTARPVFRIDLSLVTSKFIGETEKNLSSLFDKAANKDWILFFDEADAIFGKRTTVKDAHDKYANQEVSYLLQRIENHPGLVILASNFKSNIDAAFARRFHSIIEFPMPTASERLSIWLKNLPEKAKLEKTLDFEDLSKKYELTGANIVNIIQYASIKALAKYNGEIKEAEINIGIRRELTKEGKMAF